MCCLLSALERGVPFPQCLSTLEHTAWLVCSVPEVHTLTKVCC